VPDLSDYELLKTPPVEHGGSRRPIGLAIIVGVLIGAAAIAAYVLFRGSSRSSGAADTTPQAASAPQPSGGQAAAVTIPPLDQTDAVVRNLVQAITSNPQIASWLATDHLIRNFTTGVTNVAGGSTPARWLPMWRPSSPFRVMQQGRDTIIDPRSYERYDPLAAAAASLDPQACARVYATLKPRIEEASRELGNPSFDRSLERAIALLLSTPEVKDPIRVRPRGIGYVFADPALEALAPAQKLLLRTGPRNVQAFKAWLRALGVALGIPEGRLSTR
jgi:hypothetical protein